MPTANDEAWERYLTATGTELDGRSYPVAADDLKRITGREPRLLAKFDQPDELPRCLAVAGYALVPVRNGEYLLCRDDIFCELPACARAEPVDSRLPFALETACRGQGEAQYIDHAFNAGLIEQFAGVSPLYLTIRGRERTGSFRYRFGGGEVVVDGVQIEVDAGYEGARDLLLIEAKIGRPRYLNVRQLYYPWRHFRQLAPHKTIRPIVLIYDIATTRYELHEVTFATTEDPTTWLHRQSRAFRLFGPEQQRLADLFNPTAQTRTPLVPQADDLTRITRLLELSEDGLDKWELAAALGVAERQVRYYREAAEYLGLVEPSEYRASAAGRQLLRAGPQPRRRWLASAVVNSWIIADLVRRAAPIDDAAIRDVILSAPGQDGGPRYNPTTAARRAKTIAAWLRWLAEEVGCFREEAGAFIAC